MTLDQFFNDHINKELTEAMEVKEPEGDLIRQIRSQLGAVRTGMPSEVKLVQDILKQNNEWELYYFSKTCVFYEIPHKDNPPAGWYNTAAVAPVKDQVVFLYDKPFLEDTVELKYYRGDKEISKAEYKKASAEEKERKEVRATADVGKTLFLFAHEAMHIFRLHAERQQARKFNDPQLYNIAADMVINRQLMKHYGKIGAQEFKFIDGGVILDGDQLNNFKEFYQISNKDKEEALKNRLNAEDVYRWLKANAKKDDKKQQQQQQQQQKVSKDDVFDKADIVKVKKGKYKGEYRKIVDRKDDGTLVTAPLDKPIEEIAKERLK
jgi:hypothetical protein